MNRILVLLAFCLLFFMIQSSYASQIAFKIADSSRVDIFPLAIGNQWIYNYDYEYRDDGAVIDQYSDTGTVSLLVLKKVATTDSTDWTIRETSSRWTNTNNIGWQGPQAKIDTFEIIENNQANHQLYRASSDIRSVLPFLPNLADTALIYRYALVDSNGGITIRSRAKNAATSFLFRFKKGVGLYSVSMIDGCTCLPYYWTSHSLRSSIITEVNNPLGDTFPHRFRLDQNYPNPFNPSTTISFAIPIATFVSLKVFDILGREVATLASEYLEAGNHFRRWDASAMPSGLYFYRLNAVSFTETKKVILLK